MPTAIDEEAYKAELWAQGNLRYITYPGPQREIYDWIRGRSLSPRILTPYVLNLHRRLGKTFLGILIAIEECLRRPGIKAKFIAPKLSQAQDILREHFSTIMIQCPPELEPSSHRNERFTFRNPRWGARNKYVFSELTLYGTREDRGNKARGTSTDVAILDEVREMTDLEHTWQSVLLPTFKHAKEPLGVMISTPPESMDHPWIYNYIPKAKSRERYVCVPASRDPTWTEEDDEMFVHEFGGRDSPGYRREIECELISDQSKLIIPEFVAYDERQDDGELKNPFVVEDWQRPSHYVGYTVGDFGGSLDYTGLLTGYVDFAGQKLIVDNEIFVRDIDTQELNKLWRLLEKDSFNDQLGVCIDLRRYADSGTQRLNDLASIWDLRIGKAPKHDAYANRAMCRTLMNQGRIIIRERCKNLIYQLRNGSIDHRGKVHRFQRTETLGHCDCIAALIFLARVADFQKNPFPKQSFSRESTWVAPKGKPQSGWEMYFGKRRDRRR